MGEKREAPSRLEGLDRAVAREIEHRRRALRFYWLLLLIPVAIAAWILFSLEGGADEAEKELKEQVAEAKTQAEDLRTAVPRAVMNTTQAPAFKQQVIESLEPSLLPRIEEAVRSELQPQQELIDDNRLAIKMLELELRLRLEALPPALLPRDLDALREELVSTRSQIETLSGEVDSIRDWQSELERTISELRSGPVGTPRSFLLKENSENDVSELGWTVAVGRRTQRGVESVEIMRGSQSLYRQDETVFGTPFSFTLRPPECRTKCATTYEVTLGYALSRMLSRDYVGMEVVTVSTEAEQDP